MADQFALPPTLRTSLAAFYGYGAAVHIANIMGWTGFNWALAPLKWQALDGFYLVLDVAVVAGLLAGRAWAVPALVFAATSQILLYTVFRAWILDVPADFVVAPPDVTYLYGLVVFHIACLAALGGVFLRNRHRSLQQ
ncbi:MAG: hypothetical protein AAGG09_09180 [Pseudomonadota bacterium]